MSIALPEQATSPAAALAPAPDPAPTRGRRFTPGLVAAAVVLLLVAVAAVAPRLLTGADPLAADPFHASWRRAARTGSAPTSSAATSSPGSCTAPGTPSASASSRRCCRCSPAASSAWSPGCPRRCRRRGAQPRARRAVRVSRGAARAAVHRVHRPGTPSLIMAIALAFAPRYARIVRAQTLLVRRSGYVEQAVAFGPLPDPAGAGGTSCPTSSGRCRPRHDRARPARSSGAVRAVVPRASARRRPSPEWGAMLSEAATTCGSPGGRRSCRARSSPSPWHLADRLGRRCSAASKEGADDVPARPVTDLHVTFGPATARSRRTPSRGISFTVERGECLAIVGESRLGQERHRPHPGRARRPPAPTSRPTGSSSTAATPLGYTDRRLAPAARPPRSASSCRTRSSPSTRCARSAGDRRAAAHPRLGDRRHPRRAGRSSC